MESSENMKGSENMESCENMKDSENMESSENMKDSENMESSENVKDSENMKGSENMKNSLRTKRNGTWLRRCLTAGSRILLLVSAFCFLSGQKAYGDLIWTPNDTFLEEHSRECDYVGRRYYANGPDGYVRVMKEPGDANVLDYIANGPVLYVSMAYDNGPAQRWALVQYYKDENGLPVEDYEWDPQEGVTVGWIDMAHLTAVYDGQSFMEEYAAQIKEVDESSAPKVSMPENGTIYLWSYPGSGITKGQLDNLPEELKAEKVYEAPDGTQWGYVTAYYYSNRDFWINLSNPGQEKSVVIQPEKPELTPAVTSETLESLEALPKTGQTGINLTIAVSFLILLTIALSGGLIYKMTKKK